MMLSESKKPNATQHDNATPPTNEAALRMMMSQSKKPDATPSTEEPEAHSPTMGESKKPEAAPSTDAAPAASMTNGFKKPNATQSHDASAPSDDAMMAMFGNPKFRMMMDESKAPSGAPPSMAASPSMAAPHNDAASSAEGASPHAEEESGATPVANQKTRSKRRSAVTTDAPPTMDRRETPAIERRACKSVCARADTSCLINASHDAADVRNW
jgi:hypothetical protein